MNRRSFFRLPLLALAPVVGAGAAAEKASAASIERIAHFNRRLDAGGTWKNGVEGDAKYLWPSVDMLDGHWCPVGTFPRSGPHGSLTKEYVVMEKWTFETGHKMIVWGWHVPGAL